MKPAWKELMIAINGAVLFLLILLATEMALGHKSQVPKGSFSVIIGNDQ